MNSINRDVSEVIAALTRNKLTLTKGSEILALPEIAQIVEEGILGRRGISHSLHAYSVMPNHVHLVFTPLGDHTPGQVCGSIKKYSAKRVNEYLSSAGPLWEKESFDHIIRSARHFDKFCQYVEQNPVEAGLADSPENYRWSSARIDFVADKAFFINKLQPFTRAEIRSRDLPHLYKTGCTYFSTFRLLDAVNLRSALDL